MPGDVVLAEVRDAEGFARVIQEIGIRAGSDRPVFLIKPAWFSPHRANFTGARELDLLLSCLPPGRRIVVEGYSGARNFGGREITPENAYDNWDWIREQDRAFRDRTGISEVLARHEAEYVNVTEEVWQGRVAPAESVREAVRRAYGPRGGARAGAVIPRSDRHPAQGSGGEPGMEQLLEPAVAQEELFGVVPRCLFELRGSVLISLAKLKTGSWSLKNLFGLIPDPLRSRWHGEGGRMLGRSIVDIAAIYRALFPVVGIVEGIYETALYRSGGRYHTDWGDYDVVEDAGLVLAGWNLVTLDCCAARAVGSLEMGGRSFARIGEQVFGEAAVVPRELADALDRHACRLFGALDAPGGAFGG
ncbi:MAG: DUF362 domain-containing protein [Bacillota bacterium]|nr:DUF362 domain-containing protein [Bacillota bacterium]